MTMAARRRVFLLAALLGLVVVMTSALLLQPALDSGPDLGPAPPPPPITLPRLDAVRCKAAARTVRIQLFGDSTQAGATRVGFARLNPARLLTRDLEMLFGPGAVLVEDRSVGGTTLAELLGGRDGRNTPWPSSVDADIVVVNHGINDRMHGETLEAYRDNLRRLAGSPARLVLETPNPIRDGGSVESNAQAMREIASELHVPVADTYAAVVRLPVWSVYLSDWAHPTQELYEYIVRASLVPALIPEVKALRCLSE